MALQVNHMANEFYFEGQAEAQAPWRFHDRGEPLKLWRAFEGLGSSHATCQDSGQGMTL